MPPENQRLSAVELQSRKNQLLENRKLEYQQNVMIWDEKRYKATLLDVLKNDSGGLCDLAKRYINYQGSTNIFAKIISAISLGSSALSFAITSPLKLSKISDISKIIANQDFQKYLISDPNFAKGVSDFAKEVKSKVYNARREKINRIASKSIDNADRILPPLLDFLSESENVKNVFENLNSNFFGFASLEDSSIARNQSEIDEVKSYQRNIFLLGANLMSLMDEERNTDMKAVINEHSLDIAKFLRSNINSMVDERLKEEEKARIEGRILDVNKTADLLKDEGMRDIIQKITNAFMKNPKSLGSILRKLASNKALDAITELVTIIVKDPELKAKVKDDPVQIENIAKFIINSSRTLSETTKNLNVDQGLFDILKTILKDPDALEKLLNSIADQSKSKIDLGLEVIEFLEKYKIDGQNELLDFIKNNQEKVINIISALLPQNQDNESKIESIKQVLNTITKSQTLDEAKELITSYNKGSYIKAGSSAIKLAREVGIQNIYEAATSFKKEPIKHTYDEEISTIIKETVSKIHRRQIETKEDIFTAINTEIAKYIGSENVAKNIKLRIEQKDFSQLDLKSLDLSNSIIDSYTFADADFSGTSFKNSTLYQVTFDRADLKDADFSSAKLSGGTFKSLISEIKDNLAQPKIENTIVYSQIPVCDLSNVDLSKFVIDKKINFEGISLFGAKFNLTNDQIKQAYPATLVSGLFGKISESERLSKTQKIEKLFFGMQKRDIDNIISFNSLTGEFIINPDLENKVSNLKDFKSVEGAIKLASRGYRLNSNIDLSNKNIDPNELAYLSKHTNGINLSNTKLKGDMSGIDISKLDLSTADLSGVTKFEIDLDNAKINFNSLREGQKIQALRYTLASKIAEKLIGKNDEASFKQILSSIEKSDIDINDVIKYQDDKISIIDDVVDLVTWKIRSVSKFSLVGMTTFSGIVYLAENSINESLQNDISNAIKDTIALSQSTETVSRDLATKVAQESKLNPENTVLLKKTFIDVVSKVNASGIEVNYSDNSKQELITILTKKYTDKIEELRDEMCEIIVKNSLKDEEKEFAKQISEKISTELFANEKLGAKMNQARQNEVSLIEKAILSAMSIAKYKVQSTGENFDLTQMSVSELSGQATIQKGLFSGSVIGGSGLTERFYNQSSYTAIGAFSGGIQLKESNINREFITKLSEDIIRSYTTRSYVENIHHSQEIHRI